MAREILRRVRTRSPLPGSSGAEPRRASDAGRGRRRGAGDGAWVGTRAFAPPKRPRLRPRRRVRKLGRGTGSGTASAPLLAARAPHPGQNPNPRPASLAASYGTGDPVSPSQSPITARVKEAVLGRMPTPPSFQASRPLRLRDSIISQALSYSRRPPDFGISGRGRNPAHRGLLRPC